MAKYTKITTDSIEGIAKCQDDMIEIIISESDGLISDKNNIYCSDKTEILSATFDALAKNKLSKNLKFVVNKQAGCSIKLTAIDALLNLIKSSNITFDISFTFSEIFHPKGTDYRVHAKKYGAEFNSILKNNFNFVSLNIFICTIVNRYSFSNGERLDIFFSGDTYASRNRSLESASEDKAHLKIGFSLLGLPYANPKNEVKYDEACIDYLFKTKVLIGHELATIRHIEILYIDIDLLAFEMLCNKFNDMINLEKLTLTGTTLTDAHIHLLLKIIDLRKFPILSLTISATKFSDETLTQIIDNLKDHETLEYLNISNAHIDMAAIQAIVSLSASKLETLNLSSTSMNDEQIEFLVNGLSTFKRLLNLDLTGNSIGQHAADALCGLIARPDASLRKLNLSSTNMNNDSIIRFLKGIELNDSLADINMSQNNVTDEVVKTLGECLKANKSIVKVDLQGTKFDYPFVKDLIEILDPSQNPAFSRKRIKPPGNTRITSLNISHITGNNNCDLNKKITSKTPIQESCRDALNKYLTTNKKYADSLKDAIIRGKIDIIEGILKNEKVSLFFTDEKGDTLIHYAINHKQITALTYLLSKGVKQGFKNNNGETPLDLAKSSNFAEAIEILSHEKPTSSKKNSSSPSKPVKKPTQPIVPSISTKKKGPLLDIAQPLQKKQKTIAFSKTHEHKSVTLNNVLDDEIKIAHPANMTPIMHDPSSFSEDKVIDWVATGNLFQLQKYISYQPENIHVGDGAGNTLLHIAIQSHQYICAKFLIDQKIPVDLKNKEGMTSFQYLFTEILQTSSAANMFYSAQLDLVFQLIKAGANTSFDLNDAKLDRSRLTALHAAVAYGQYRLMKILLQAPGCDLNKIDNKGWTPLHWAVTAKDIDMVDRLLIDRRLTPKTIDNALFLAKNEFTQIRDLDVTIKLENIMHSLKHRQDYLLPTPASGLQWTKKLSIVYGSRRTTPEKTIYIDAEKHHAHLAMSNEFSARRLFKSKDSADQETFKDQQGNPVTASLTFITSIHPYKQGENHPRQKIIIPLDFISEFHVSGAAEHDLSKEEVKEKIINRVKAAPPVFFTSFSRSKHQPCNADEVEALYEASNKSADPNYQLTFHHGEQALLNYLGLEKTIRELVQRLRDKPKFALGCKIYGVILDIHSPRYTCENCEVGILGTQNSKHSLFLKQLSEGLKIVGCVLPRFSDLRLLTQISSYIPYHNDPISEEGHSNFKVDMRACNNNLILAKDLSTCSKKQTQFHSSKLKL